MALNVEGEMTIYVANELRQRLLASLQNDATVEIDLSGVSEIDSAGVQLLISARREAAAKGKEFQLVALSHAVSEVLKVMNLTADFHDSIVAS